MPKLPVISGRKLVKHLNTLGYVLDHQTGSHMILRNKIPPHCRLVIPDHSELAKGTLSAVIRQAGLSRKEFFDLLGK